MANDKKHTSVLRWSVSLCAGVLGFVINSRFSAVSFEGLDFTIIAGSVPALLISLVWGWQSSIPAALLAGAALFVTNGDDGLGLIYLYPFYTVWIPLFGFYYKREMEKGKGRYATYLVLFIYALIHIAGYLLIYNTLLGMNASFFLRGGYRPPLDYRRLLILSYKDNMLFFSGLNLVRLILMIPGLGNRTSQGSNNEKKPDGYYYVLAIIGAVIVLWIFTLFSISFIESGMIFSHVMKEGISGRTIMANFIYFNLIIVSAIIFYQNWDLQNRTARRLTEEGDILTILLNNITEGVLALDDDWKICFANPAAFNLGKYGENDLGKSVEEVVFLYSPNKGRRYTHEEIVEKLSSGQPFVCLLKTRLGSFRRINMEMSVLPDSRYGFRFISLVRDITEEYDREQENIHTQKQEAIGRLVGGVAHDFNNRLAGIMGFSQLIDLETEKSEIRGYADQILQSSQAAADLTSQLLTLSRKRPINNRLLNLSELIKDLFPLLEKTLGKGIIFSLDDSKEPLTIMGDKSLLENSLINLAVNASDAMNKKGKLNFKLDTVIVDDIYSLKSLAALKTGRFARLSVSDTGPGIKEELFSRIFDPFFTTKEEGKGTGLGLSTVKEIMEKHGGEVTVENLSDSGCRFNLIFPLVNNQEGFSTKKA